MHDGCDHSGDSWMKQDAVIPIGEFGANVEWDIHSEGPFAVVMGVILVQDQSMDIIFSHVIFVSRECADLGEISTCQLVFSDTLEIDRRWRILLKHVDTFRGGIRYFGEG